MKAVLCIEQDVGINRPAYNPEKLLVDKVEVVVQINGKVRGRITVSSDCPEEQLIEEARDSERIGELLKDRKVLKTSSSIIQQKPPRPWIGS
ncbi:MAG: hypothetical protein R6U55_00185 [Desulfovermiculus sp.]